MDKDNIYESIGGVKELWERTSLNKSNGDYHYLKEINNLEGPWVYVENQKMLMFATYNYLGLLDDERIKQESIKAIEKYGTGTHGVRNFGGSLDIHGKLEKRIADFVGRKYSIAYSTGYMTNLSTINAIVGRKDWILSDKLNHASIVDGCLISGAVHKRFQHNDMSHLESLLSKAPENVTKLVVADAVFSMDGDIFNLPDAVELCNKYNALLMIDEAHSLGILGQNGRGIEEHFNMKDSIDIKMGTLSKAIPAIGGYIACNNEKLITYLKHLSRGFIFSAAIPPAIAAAAYKTLEILETEGAAKRDKLKNNVDLLLKYLHNAGFNTGNTETPIIPIMLGADENAIKMTTYCQNNNIFVLPVISPAVPVGQARLRVNVTAAHTSEDIKTVADIIIKGGKKFGFIDYASN
ncbi:8-amino-7-oxononanoate synthase [Anaerosporobacter mobilis DSM 15930]|uniref:8-amino-7-oxononanoate synthase n=1 Tax=Anaerosporobacter mobilis DSM 15930 TaxID=1120996 RepID=A0A1M7LVY7_9FIRM|nr:pyridoxal phosphate-dependent aminotransferase family protein [Anaerosporobacter mobilis]SHM82400.1 8-amino-7-oxononanoate synthase [Anaerosporobacter mobilis DSM 15930]